MIEQIAPHTLNNTYVHVLCQDDSLVILFHQQHFKLLRNEGSLTFPTASQLHLTASQKQAAYYLFSLDNTPCFLVEEELEAEELEVIDEASLRTLQPAHVRFAAVTARQIALWRTSHLFCGVCGKKLIDRTTERARVCESCKEVSYPTLSPAVITAMIDRKTNRLLVSRTHQLSAFYSLIAGYVEVGETLEETVSRELMEEVGLKAKNIKYFGSQPWGFSGSQMIAFVSELDGSPTITLQTSELSEALWITKEQVEENSQPLSIGHQMMQLFRQGKL